MAAHLKPQIMPETCVKSHAIDTLRRLVREDVRLTFDLDAGPASVMIDPHDLEQVVLNLVMKARDALSAGGAIHVSPARETIAAGDPRLGDEAAAGEDVHLCVRDSGDGMSAVACPCSSSRPIRTHGRRATPRRD